MAKKKYKSKNKSKICPHGNIFAEDWNDIPECRSCKLASQCETAYKNLDKNKPKEKRKQDNRGLYIPRPALNKLLALSYHSCMRLYCFYMKEGMRQKTNSPWCNNYFTAKRLKCSIGTVVTAKNLLIKAGFIKIVGKRGEQGHFGKTFIELKYYPSKFVIEKEEYLRRLDKYAEQLAEWANVFTSEKMKLEIRLFEQKQKYEKLKCRYRKLKAKKYAK